MLPDNLKIQFSAPLVLFLVWLIFNLLSQVTSFKTTKHETAETGTTGTTATTDHTHNSFGSRVTSAERPLLDAFYLLSIAVFFNVFLNGNKTSGDTFSLIAMFAAIFAAIGFLAGVRLAGKAFWILFVLSIFAILVTAFATPLPSFNSLFRNN